MAIKGLSWNSGLHFSFAASAAETFCQSDLKDSEKNKQMCPRIHPTLHSHLEKECMISNMTNTCGTVGMLSLQKVL